MNIGVSSRIHYHPEETYHKFMVVLMDQIVLTLTVWGEQCDSNKTIWKFSQVMRGHEKQHDIYDDETIRLIMWHIIGNGRQYFIQSLMPSAFTENITEDQIVLLT